MDKLNLTELRYPLYVSPIWGEPFFSNNDTFGEIGPTQKKTLGLVTGYILKDRLYISDFFDINFMASKTDPKLLSFHDRLINLRRLVNVLNDCTKYIDLPVDTVNSAQEILELEKLYMEQGARGVILRSIDTIPITLTGQLKYHELLFEGK